PAVREPLVEAARTLGRASAPTFSAKGVELETALTEGRLQGVFDALLTKNQEIRKFSEKLAGLETVRAAQALAQRLCGALAQHEAWLHHGRIARLARLLLQAYAQLKREHGWVDM